MMDETYPKIGIRPVVDGRRGGIRESLEEVTMNLARSAAELFRNHLRYPNGQPVQVVIADTCIGGITEAVAANRQFAALNVGATLTVTPSWCYPTETMDQDPILPKAVWGFNGTERPGAVYLAAVQAAHNQKGLPVFSIYGHNVQDMGDTSIESDVEDKLLRFGRSALAVALMRNKSYLSIGTVAMGIAGCIPQEDFFQSYLGMRNEYVDMTELLRRIDGEIYDKAEFQTALEWVHEYCKEGVDVNPPEVQRSRLQKDEDWETVVKMTLIIRDLMIGNPVLDDMGYGEEALGHSAIAAGFQGQRAWTDQYPNGDFAEAILTSSFDWNGTRLPYMLATENDSLNAATMLFGSLLTNRAQIFADVRTYWSPEAIERVVGKKPTGMAEGGVIHLTNSGSAALDGSGQQTVDGTPVMKPWWEVSETDVKACLEATSWCPAVDFFRGGGFSSRYVSRGGMPVTMARINVVKDLGPVLQLVEGYTVELPEDMHRVLDERTNPTWPATWFVPRLTGEGAFRDVYSVMNNWGSNHCAVSYGHVGADLLTLASMLRIPVNMHNIPDADVFRPSVWSQFGTNDPESADYRACRTYGPIYV
ncbi:L-fucose isomerase [Alicyclobacillus sp. SO9]|nr:L-fucose isomerase [Alicyclobacillus sp. SO9]